MKRIEFSENMKDWKVIGEWSDEEAKDKWPRLQKFIEDHQPYGFFRMVDVQ